MINQQSLFFLPINLSQKKYNSLSYKEVIDNELRVMDLTAITLCKENMLPIHVFNINKNGDLKKAILGESIGTIINV